MKLMLWIRVIGGRAFGSVFFNQTKLKLLNFVQFISKNKNKLNSSGT